ncbi:hypothetical protein GS440_19380 [Rhodococcus hoagii]|nr:hypothetical protein [Prescottella equi]
MADWLGRTATFDRVLAEYDRWRQRSAPVTGQRSRAAPLRIVSLQQDQFYLVHNGGSRLPPRVLAYVRWTLGSIGGLSDSDSFGMESLELLDGLDGLIVLAPRGDLAARWPGRAVAARPPAVAAGRVQQAIDQRLRSDRCTPPSNSSPSFDTLLSPGSPDPHTFPNEASLSWNCSAPPSSTPPPSPPHDSDRLRAV